VIISVAGNAGIIYIAGIAIIPPAVPTITVTYLSGTFLIALHNKPNR
jgi:hypothetical protein